jgi:uncharacterized protein
MALAEFIKAEFSLDGRFKIILEHIRNFGASREFPVDVMSHEEMKSVRDKVAMVITDELMGYDPPVNCCYAAMPNHFVVRANGKIQKCTVALYDERNDIGQLMPDGTIVFNGRDRIIAWSRGLLQGDLEKMSCPLRDVESQLAKDVAAYS